MDEVERPQVTLGAKYNPYDDATLSTAQPEPPVLNEREPFNDVVKHQDIIAFHQRNRTLSDYSRKKRVWVRLWSILGLVLFAVGLMINVMGMFR